MHRRSALVSAVALVVALVAAGCDDNEPGSTGTSRARSTPLADSRIAVLDIIDHPPPIASLITVGIPAPDGTTTVSGAADAVPSLALVLVASLSYSDPAFVKARTDGSFDTTIPTAPGDWIQVRYRVDDGLDTFVPQDLHQTNHWPGTLIRAAPWEPVGGFAGAIHRGVESGIARGLASGTVSETQLAVGESTRVVGSVSFRIPEGASVPSTVNYSGQLALSPLFDAAGNQVGAGTDFISHLLTPSGLPIERAVRGGVSGAHFAITAARDGDLLTGSFDARMAIPAGLPDGIYRLYVVFHLGPDFNGLGVEQPQSAMSLTQPTDGAVSAAIVTVGDAAPPRLAAMLLTDSPSQGQRGTVAREDAARIGFANRIAAPGQRLIITPRDLGSGELIAYRLEPFLPFVSLADRNLPQEPAIPFDLPGGSLTVTVTTPGGRSEELGTLTIRQARTGHGASSTGNVLDSGGGNPGSVYQLTTLSDDFAYKFLEYGRYEIRLSGSVPDIWGNNYSLDSVFDVWVAETLDLEASSLPSTPFEVGDNLPASLSIFPGVPAAIEWEVTVHPIDGSAAKTRKITGVANRFGYFSVADAFHFDVAGEYLSTIHASYTDTEGRLWMATRTWGSGIATPDGALIAHGRRGIDAQPAEERAAWFTRSSTEIPEGGNHVSFPYHSGDILWSTDGDAAQARISVQDTVGVIEALIEARFDQSDVEDNPALRVALGALPLGISTSTGLDPTIDPAEIDQLAYAYRAVERPGIRVRETIGTDFTTSPYWRFDETYLLQQGMGSRGELPNDLKWQFGAAVFRRPDMGIGEVAIYASLWVEIHSDDPRGSRVFPPFQGAAGGPSGGPILTLKGEAIDLFILPTAIQPGSVLEVGDRFIFAGQVGPPLASKVSYSVTSPSGATQRGAGQANAIGYYADPAGAFSVDEPGIWIVRVEVLHDGETSAGAVEPPFPTGGVLGSDGGSYTFFVVDPAALTLDAGLDAFNIASLGVRTSDLDPIHFFVDVPVGWTSVQADYVIRMPGFILETGQATLAGGQVEVVYDPVRLHEDFPNIDLSRRQDHQPGLADEVMVTIYLSGTDSAGTSVNAAKLLTLVGEDIYDLN
jgi:hypothetical protein